MNNNKFTEVVLGIVDECKELLIKKGEDYSTDKDRISHFKDAERFTSLSRWQVWEALFFKHIQGIRTYMKSGRKGLNEDIHHRIRDAINYLIILEAMLVEEKGDAANQDKQEVEVKDYQQEEIPVYAITNPADTYYCATESEYAYIKHRKGFLSPQFKFYSWKGKTWFVPKR